MVGAETAYETIGKPSISRRCAIGSSIERGRSMRTRAMASLTSFKARSWFTSSWNWIIVCDDPSVTVEVMCLTPLMPANASSTLRVTCVSSSAGAAPDCVTRTMTTGMSMLGKRATGIERKLTMPSVIRTRNSTSAGTGLRIDHAEMLRFIA